MRLSQSLCRLDFGFFNVVDIKSMFFLSNLLIIGFEPRCQNSRH